MARKYLSRGQMMVEMAQQANGAKGRPPVKDTNNMPNATTAASVFATINFGSQFEADGDDQIDSYYDHGNDFLHELIAELGVPNLLEDHGEDLCPDGAEALITDPVILDDLETVDGDFELDGVSEEVTFQNNSINMLANKDDERKHDEHYDKIDQNSIKETEHLSLDLESDDPSYVPNTESESSDLERDDPNYVPETESESSDLEPEDNNYIPETESESSDNEQLQDQPSKRRRKSEDENQEKHTIGEPCNDKCRLQCCKSISQERREEIWQDFWTLTYNDRKTYLFSSIEKSEKARETTKNQSQRSFSYRYKLRDSDGQVHQVCKTFILTTHGFDKKNDKPVMTALKGPLTASLPEKDKRGRKEPANKIDRTLITQHIESFNPSISHYRRSHAPNRRYLPSEINIVGMYEDFKEKNNQFKCSYDLYRSCVKEMNISFAKLGEEGCEVCEEYHMNKTSHGHPAIPLPLLQNVIDETDDVANALPYDCDKCLSWLEHIRAAKMSRKAYQDDAILTSDDTDIRSVDLQKVIMLPRMPGFKTAMFTRRIIAFHETFAPVGVDRPGKRRTVSVLWHEAIAGRKQEEITSAYIKVLLQHTRDMAHVIFWLDNCAAQNKNWCLFTALVILMNTPSTTIQDVTLKYFTRGHTFMSADSVHPGVEKSMKQVGNIFDYDDFVEAVRTSNRGKIDVVTLTNEDFLNFESGHSATKVKKSNVKLSELSQVQVRRGSSNLFLKRKHEDGEFTTLNYLKRNFAIEMPTTLRDEPRGVSLEKKQGIQKNLCPLMPENRRSFWNNLDTDDNLEDLIEM